MRGTKFTRQRVQLQSIGGMKREEERRGEETQFMALIESVSRKKKGRSFGLIFGNKLDSNPDFGLNRQSSFSSALKYESFHSAQLSSRPTEYMRNILMLFRHDLTNFSWNMTIRRLHLAHTLLG